MHFLTSRDPVSSRLSLAGLRLLVAKSSPHSGCLNSHHVAFLYKRSQKKQPTFDGGEWHLQSRVNQSCHSSSGSKVKPLVSGNSARWDHFHTARLFFLLISQLICCGGGCCKLLAPLLVVKCVCQAAPSTGSRVVFFDGGLLCQGRDLHRKSLIPLPPCPSVCPKQSECIRKQRQKCLCSSPSSTAARDDQVMFQHLLPLRLVPWRTRQQKPREMHTAHLCHLRA